MMKMIVCILFALLIVALYLKGWYTNEVRLVIYCTALILILTISITSRTYQGTGFRASYPLADCKVVNQGKDIVKVKTPVGEYLVKKEKVVYYTAPDKDSEVLEISGEHRIYSSTAPDLLYYLYYLKAKEDSTETVIGGINISKAE
jgi:hypothetical protein